MIKLSAKAQRNMPIVFAHDLEEREWDRLLGAALTARANSPASPRRIESARQLLAAYGLTVKHVDWMRWLQTRWDQKEPRPADWDERVKSRGVEEEAAMWIK